VSWVNKTAREIDSGAVVAKMAHFMKRTVLLVLSIQLAVAFGCAKKPEVTSMQRKEAAALVSEAEFAITIRDYPRAETLMQQAVELCPDNGSYFLSLGNLSLKNGKKPEAKKAFGSALEAYQDAYKADPTDGSQLMRQMYVQALLGNADDARKLLRRAKDKHPKNPEVNGFDEKALDRMLADPGFKAMAL
jgi:tetratricopeptide (TPR) repeat protein